MRKCCASILISLLAIATPIHAEYFGLPNGRSADLDKLPGSSIEVGFATGDIPDDADYQNFGGRFNYLASPGTMLFFDLGLAEIEEFDGNLFGIGVFFEIDGVFTSADFALKGSYHTGSLDEDRFELDIDTISVEGLFSGREPISTNGMTWYGNVGVHRLKSEVNDANSNSETEFGFGGGIIIPSKSGELFAGIDLIDEISFGFGYRYFLQ